MTAMTAVTETRPGHSSHSTYATYRPREPAERHHSQEEPVAVKGTSAPWPATATTVEVEKPAKAASAARAGKSEAAAGPGESPADRPLLGLSRGARRAGRRRQRGAVARGCGGREQHALLVGRKPCSDVREPEEDAGADEVEERGGSEPRPLPHDLPILAPAARAAVLERVARPRARRCARRSRSAPRRAGAGQRPRTDRVRESRTRRDRFDRPLPGRGGEVRGFDQPARRSRYLVPRKASLRSRGRRDLPRPTCSVPPSLKPPPDTALRAGAPHGLPRQRLVRSAVSANPSTVGRSQA